MVGSDRSGARTLASAIGLAAAMAVAACAPPPAVTTFPELPDGARATAISDDGDVVGSWLVRTGTTRPIGGYGFVRLADGTVVDRLLDPSGTWPASRATDVNDDGLVVGDVYSPRRAGTEPGVPFFWTRSGGTVPLPTIEGEDALRAVAVTDDGRILVTRAHGNRAFIYDTAAGRYDELPAIPGYRWTVVGMNDRGDVIGTSRPDPGSMTTHAVVWRGPAHTPTVLAGTGATEARPIEARPVAINDDGVVVAGRFDVVANSSTIVVWPSADGLPLDFGPGSPSGLNDRGCMVGVDDGGAHAWSIAGGPATKTPLTLTGANDVNDQGTIVGHLEDTTTYAQQVAISTGCPSLSAA